MSVTRTFIVTVANPGAGNRYYIDGNLQETVNLAEGYTYRFDQSDSSNGYPVQHPFKFSTTSNGTHSGGSEYTTGVTYNGTPGNAGAYTQIVVAASAPQLYYYCSLHSGMGGSANTVESDTWGVLGWSENNWGNQDGVDLTLTGLSTTASVGTATAFPNRGFGAQTWGTNDWGEADVSTVPLTGLSITSDIGSVIASADRGWGADAWSNGEWGELNDDTAILTGLSFSAEIGTAVGSSEQGWGRAEWGQEPWGESFSPTVALTGLSIVSELGELPYAQSEEGWGRDEWGVGNWGQNITLVALDGISMSAHLGPDGWGVNSFGNGQWGGEFTFKPESIIVPTGQTASASLGSATIGRLDMIFSISSPGTIGVGLGTPGINNGADHQQGLASLTAAAAVGSVTAAPNTIAELTGLTATTEVGSVSVGSVELIDLTGVVLKGAVGSTTTDAMRVGLTGVTSTAEIGAVTVTNMTVGLTGQSITANINTVGLGTIGYQDVDITGNTSYTDVNHAA